MPCSTLGPVGQPGQIAVIALGDELPEDPDGLLDEQADQRGSAGVYVGL
jgi:hypothetical protein